MERQTELTAESLWNDVSARLREALNDTTYSTWFGEVDGASLDDDTFAVAVPNDFTREWIEGHFLDLIRAAVKDASGKELRVQLRVVESAVPPPQPSNTTPSAVSPLPAEVIAPRSEGRPTVSRTRQPSRSPKRRRRHTTRSSSTATPDWGKRTFCMRSRTSSPITAAGSPAATSPRRRS